MRRNASAMAVALWVRQRRWDMLVNRANEIDRVDPGNVIGMQGFMNGVLALAYAT